MSYTQFVRTSKCEVADDFNVKEYLKSLADFVGNHVDDLNENVSWLADMEYDDLIGEFEKYVCQNGNTISINSDTEIFINSDTEENNNDTDLWDWLSDQIREDVMTSKFMTINLVTINYRKGVNFDYCFVMKDGTKISSTEIPNIIEQYLKMSN